MIQTLLTILLTTLFLTFVSSYIILRAAVPKKPLRRVLFLFVILTPLAAIVAFAKTLYQRPRPVRYSAEMGRIEDEIENERVRLFRGPRMHPSFSERWKLSYLYAIERSAAAAAKFDPALEQSLCAISR